MMSMPLFDLPTSNPARTVTLVRLAAEVARSTGAIGRVCVDGEVHRPTVSRGGWVFFTLRDRAAQIDVKVPRVHVARCRAVGGERVRVTGVLDWSADRGQLHLRAEEVVPVGAGAISAMLAETRSRLQADGLTSRRRIPVPLLPAVIGVVCGADAAVRKDIESVVAAQAPGYPVVFEETTVSGPNAAGAIVAAVASLLLRPGVEVIILARGGGDPTSLLPWSDEAVCRAVAGAGVAVVSAIGHDGDRPLCDEVADLRCGTPSLAATAVVPDLASLRARVDAALAGTGANLGQLLSGAGRALEAAEPGRAAASSLAAGAMRLDASGRRLADAHPRRLVEQAARRVAALEPARNVWELLGRAGGRLESSLRHMDALDPDAVLRRGYAVVRKPSGEVLRDASSVATGDELHVRLARGALVATVGEVGAGEVRAGEVGAGEVGLR